MVDSYPGAGGMRFDVIDGVGVDAALVVELAKQRLLAFGRRVPQVLGRAAVAVEFGVNETRVHAFRPRALLQHQHAHRLRSTVTVG